MIIINNKKYLESRFLAESFHYYRLQADYIDTCERKKIISLCFSIKKPNNY